MTKLYIKNMVCPRCIKVVNEELQKLGYHPMEVKLGEVLLKENENEIDKNKIKEVLNNEGFELLEDERARIISSIKTEIIKAIQKYSEIDLEKLVISKFLSEKLSMDYTYLSSLFSKKEGITIEHYVIMQKIEKAKELLKYGELSLSEISYQLGYSSVQHLSRQFKQVTGLTASQFRNNIKSDRKPISDI